MQKLRFNPDGHLKSGKSSYWPIIYALFFLAFILYFIHDISAPENSSLIVGISRRVREATSQLSLTDFFRTKRAKGIEATVVAVCPLSDMVIRAALESAKENNYPVLFAISRDQADLEGGYTGWDAKEIVAKIREIAKEVGFKGPLYLGREHAGPWTNYSDIRNGLNEAQAMERAKQSLKEDIEAGFECIQIDATVDPNGKVDIETAVRRTVELIKFVHQEAKGKKISFSVGGGKREMVEDISKRDTAERFLSRLKEELRRAGLNEVNLDFFVPHAEGKASSSLEIPPPEFDPQRVREIFELAKRQNMFLKWHHGDNMSDGNLRLFPEVGIDIANAGPELAVVETQVYLDLEAKERRALEDSRQLHRASNFTETVKNAIIRDGLYQKLVNKRIEEITLGEWQKIVVVSARYVYPNPAVQEAFRRLFSNLKELNIEQNPQKAVVETLKKTIRRFELPFKLDRLTTTVGNGSDQ